MEELLQTLTVSLRIYVQNYRFLMILFLAILYSTLILPLFSFLMLCEDILSLKNEFVSSSVLSPPPPPLPPPSPPPPPSSSSSSSSS